MQIIVNDPGDLPEAVKSLLRALKGYVVTLDHRNPDTGTSYLIDYVIEGVDIEDLPRGQEDVVHVRETDEKSDPVGPVKYIPVADIRKAFVA